MFRIHLPVSFRIYVLIAIFLRAEPTSKLASAFIPSTQNSYLQPLSNHRSLLQLSSSITPLDLAQSTLPSVALILPLGVRNTTARGSGFVINFPMNESEDESKDVSGDTIYLLTAAHVALPGYRIQVVFYPNQCNVENENTSNLESVLLSATVVGRDVQSDLALLQVNISETDFVPPPPLLISTQNKAAIGTPAYTMGYPSGGVVGPAMTSGIVCGNALGLVTTASVGDILENSEMRNETSSNKGNDGGDNKDKTRYIVTDAAMAGGMSGGPLVDGNSGTVLGLNALINMELRALGNYAVSAAECVDFLKKLSTQSNNGVERQTQGNPVYQVVLYNDRFNKRARVQSLLESIAKLNSTASNKAMMDAHTKGRGVVKEFFGEDAEARELCDALRKEDLLVELETVY